jgi:hypothetical protein
MIDKIVDRKIGPNQRLYQRGPTLVLKTQSTRLLRTVDEWILYELLLMYSSYSSILCKNQRFPRCGILKLIKAKKQSTPAVVSENIFPLVFYKHARRVLLGRMECDKMIIPHYNNDIHQVQLIFSRLCSVRHMRHITAPCYRASFLTNNARGICHPKNVSHEA